MSKFHARHYEAIADVIQICYKDLYTRIEGSNRIIMRVMLDRVVSELDHMFREDNKRYNPKRFKGKCYNV